METKLVYIAVDGEIFDNKERCEFYESGIDFTNKISRSKYTRSYNPEYSIRNYRDFVDFIRCNLAYTNDIVNNIQNESE